MLYFFRKPLLFATALLLVLSSRVRAQSQELGLTLGSFVPMDRTGTAGIPFNLGSGTTLQADYEHRFWSSDRLALYGGVHFLANPQRLVSGSERTLTHDIATLYITPGVMLKAFPKSRYTPWAVIGGGYGDYEQSMATLNGDHNAAPRQLARGVLHFGGGLDVPIWRFLALRGEVHDFVTGNPAYNVHVNGAQHNVSVGGGIVVRWGER